MTYDSASGRLRYRLGYAQFAQVTPYDAVTARQPGFTDPYFTSEDTATLSYRGTQHEVLGSLQWNGPWLQASLDLVDDFLRRAAPQTNPEEGVHMDYPQALVTLSHAGKNAVYAAGEGRFALSGCYALCETAAVQLEQRVYFAGLTFAVAPRSSWLLEWRRYVTDGVPFVDFSSPPAYTGTRVILEERFTLSP